MSDGNKCSWVEYGDTIPCGESSEGWHGGSHLCHKHMSVRLASKGTALRQGSRFYWPEQLPGFCYVLELVDGTFKIGFSWTEKNLKNRLRSHERNYPGHTVRRILPGGPFTEARLHERFWEYRVPGKSEEFYPCQDLEDLLNDPADGGYTPENPVEDLLTEPQE